MSKMAKKKMYPEIIITKMEDVYNLTTIYMYRFLNVILKTLSLRLVYLKGGVGWWYWCAGEVVRDFRCGGVTCYN